MTFTRGRVTLADVPWESGAYRLSVRGEGREPAHNHDNNYWHDGPTGTSRLEIRFYNATDRGCGVCDTTGVSIAAGSPIAKLAGSTSLSDPYVAFDHNRIATGAISLSSRLHPTFPSQRPGGFIGVSGTPGASGATFRGVLVTSVDPGDPADNAGIRNGDLILAVNYTHVATLEGLARLLRSMRPGTLIMITIVRHGQRKDVAVTLAQAP
jgi:hypothetical protein